MLMLAVVTLLALGGNSDGARFRGTIDWSQVRPIEDFPHIAARVEQLKLRAGEPSLPAPRIVGGSVATAGQIPYQAAVLSDLPNGQALCGGALLSSNYVLTAGVCVEGTSGGVVVLGALNLQNEAEAGQVRITFAAGNVRLHEEFLGVIFRNNIAVIRLSESVTFSDRIQPVRLPVATESRTFAGVLATVSGFGRTSDASTSFSDVLRYVRNPIMTNADCFDTAWGGLIDGQKLCLHYADARAPCDGDVGGPMTVVDGGSSLLVGLYSFGSVLGCETDWPAVFVRITFYRQWIVANTDVTQA
ncbi:AGAP005642-PA-like protein [Anopheles sinensis]|uniref:AGAP005642-PA-like protein n=1 Tax=Anopheles sinensis TaxID=74873 RepID=A0A084WA70_ANOSI|nr:AGAP005642-PA-like protein [Anopheles sinensis]